MNQKKVLLTEDNNNLRKQIKEMLINQEILIKKLKLSLDKEKDLNKMKAGFASMISHEIRTPLSIINASVELLENYYSKLSTEEKQEQYIIIKKEIAYLVEMVNDILLLGKFDTQKMPLNNEVINVKTLFQDLIKGLERINKVRKIKLEYHGNEIIETDKKLFEHIIMNLINNALKYSDTCQEIQVIIHNSDESINIEFRDKGIGIPANQISHIFDPFYRAQNATTIKGTGIGLYIVKVFISFLDGKITVKSEIDKGTSFFISIPNKGEKVEPEKNIDH